jgi:hypothetical protein
MRGRSPGRWLHNAYSAASFCDKHCIPRRVHYRTLDRKSQHGTHLRREYQTTATRNPACYAGITDKVAFSFRPLHEAATLHPTSYEHGIGYAIRCSWFPSGNPRHTIHSYSADRGQLTNRGLKVPSSFGLTRTHVCCESTRSRPAPHSAAIRRGGSG